MAATFVLQP